jgi:peptide/nickel transport system substrate-binding protein
MDAEDPAEQKRLAEAMQRRAFEDIPYLPTGAFTQPTAFRSNVTGMLNGFPIFHNIRRG